MPPAPSRTLQMEGSKGSRASWNVSLGTIPSMADPSSNSSEDSSHDSSSNNVSNPSYDSAALYAADMEDETASVVRKNNLEAESKANGTSGWQQADQKASLRSNRFLTLVVATMVVAAILVGTLVHQVAKQSDEDEFHSAVSSMKYEPAACSRYDMLC